MIKETIGVIGVGNMGSAILEGLFRKKLARPAQVWVYDKIKDKAAEFSRHWKVQAASSNADLVSRAEVVLLAVKPQDLESTGAELRAFFKKSHVLISILAGTPLAKIRPSVGSSPSLVRAMPNLGAKVGESVTALAGADAQSLSVAEQIFSGCGKTVRLEEKHFDLVTAVSGSGPAYFFLLMEVLADFAVRNGLDSETAQTLAVQTAVGAGLLAQSTQVSPAEFRKQVTSKGGTTEAALKVLEDKNFAATFREALDAAVRRGRELSR